WYSSTASDTREPGDLERSGGDPAYLRTERATAQWHRLRGRGLDQPCDPRSDADTDRYCQQPTGGRELGDSYRAGVGSCRVAQRQPGAIVGGFGGERDWQQSLLGEHGHLYYVGRLERLVRPRSTAASAGELRAVGMRLCLWLPGAADCGVAVCESDIRFAHAT